MPLFKRKDLLKEAEKKKAAEEAKKALPDERVVEIQDAERQLLDWGQWHGWHQWRLPPQLDDSESQTAQMLELLEKASVTAYQAGGHLSTAQRYRLRRFGSGHGGFRGFQHFPAGTDGFNRVRGEG